MRKTEQTLQLRMRRIVPKQENGDLHQMVKDEVCWDPKRTAAIVCDMWNHHWCKGAEARTGEMALRMNEVLKTLRSKGVLIIHAPSGTLEFYKDHPGRRMAQEAPVVDTGIPVRNWVKLDPAKEGPLPVDDSDGGCGCEPRCKEGLPWTRQIETLEIMEGDAVTDSVEAYYLMKQREIDNVMIMGVHTNMCVLGRPFGIRQLVNLGLNVVLMRDLTDSMYNPAMQPCVDHFTGTDLIIGHIERYWCPTVTSDQIIGGEPFRFREDTRRELSE